MMLAGAAAERGASGVAMNGNMAAAGPAEAAAAAQIGQA
jgi:hypothetical protein